MANFNPLGSTHLQLIHDAISPRGSSLGAPELGNNLLRGEWTMKDISHCTNSCISMGAARTLRREQSRRWRTQLRRFCNLAVYWRTVFWALVQGHFRWSATPRPVWSSLRWRGRRSICHRCFPMCLAGSH